MLRATTLALVLPAVAAAQTLPATHAFSGLDATSARTRLERAGPRPYGPAFEAAAMRLAPALDLLPGQKDRQPVPAIRVVKPPFRLPEQDLGIADVQDILFFAEARLARMRIHLKSAGEPLARRWTDQLRRYFAFLDRDADGELNRLEAEHALSNAGVVQMLQTGYAYQRPDDAARTFAEADRDADGKLGFDEFAHYYAPSAGRVISAFPNPHRDVYADALTDELFKRFDTDNDGRLSRAELTAVERLVAALDANEDECLSAPEVVPGVFDNRSPRPFPAPKAAPAEQLMMAFRPTAVPDSMLETILSRYDRDRNLRLTRGENPFGDETFAALDRDGNGDLSVTELLAWKNAAPDLEVEMVLGARDGESAIRLLARPDGKPAPLASAFRPAGAGAGALVVGNQTVQLSCYTPRGVYGRTEPPGFLAFPEAGNKGYITEKDIGGPQFQSFRILFDMIDRDADGRMSRKEFDDFVALQQSFTRLPLSLVYAAQTPSLFQLLDASGDGRLSVREVREAWSRLIALEPTGKEFVTKAALRPQGALKFGRSAESVMANPSTVYTQPQPRQSARGPLWFRKFDRNADGELSRGEFPGPAAEFDRLDADRDDYVSVEEAEAADKKLRAGK